MASTIWGLSAGRESLEVPESCQGLSPQWPCSYAGHVLTGCSPGQLQAFLGFILSFSHHILPRSLS